MNSVQKLYELEIHNADVYVLITTPEKIIINNVSIKTGQEGINIFDHELGKNDYIPLNLKESVEIYNFFKKSNECEIIFYCPDNERLLHVDILQKKISIIPLSHAYRNIIFSPIYHWDREVLILSDYKGNFYKISLKDKTIVKDKKISATFSDFYKQAITKAIKVYPNLYRYIAKDGVNLECIDFINNKKIIIPNIYYDAHDYDYKGGMFMLIGENEIALLSSEKDITKITPEKSYKFLRASFLNNSSFVTLSVNDFNNKLTVFKI